MASTYWADFAKETVTFYQHDDPYHYLPEFNGVAGGVSKGAATQCAIPKGKQGNGNSQEGQFFFTITLLLMEMETADPR